MESDRAVKNERRQYSKRIRYLRRLILTTVVAACLIPTCICIILAVRYDRLRAEYEQVTADLSWYRGQYGNEIDILSADNDADRAVIKDGLPEGSSPGAQSEGTSVSFESTDPDGMDVDYATIDVTGARNPEDIEGTRYVYLTFDDGPSTNTDDILDVLAKYDVKATFFVCGKPNAKYTEAYKRIVNEGHTLGMHSYSHKYSEIYSSLDAFKTDLDKLRIFLYETTGVWSSFYRFPGGSSNSVSEVNIKDLVEYLDAADVVFFDWNVSAGDDKAGANKDVIYNNIVSNVPRFKHCVVLMHDAADKKSTVEALPDVIEAIQAMEDTVIVPITDDTLPVQHIN